MASLEKRVRDFHEHDFKMLKTLYEELHFGQHPEVLFITCSDSRILPNQLTQSKPGELFIIRNAGNIIPSYPDLGGEHAAIEFALTNLPIKHIVVCGHSQCGAMKGVIEPSSLEHMPAVQQWLKHAPGAEEIKQKFAATPDGSLLDTAVAANVLLQIQHLKQNPCVKLKLEAGQITLHPWIYEFEKGTVHTYDDKAGHFQPLFPENEVGLRPSTHLAPLSAHFLLRYLNTFTLSAECGLVLLGLWRSNPYCIITGLSLLAGSYLGSKIGFFTQTSAPSNASHERTLIHNKGM